MAGTEAGADRYAISDVCDRYLCLLDEGRFGEAVAGTVFTPDVLLAFPPGSHQGIAGMDAFTEVFMGHWARTHHHPGFYRVEVDGDAATVTFSVVATHVHRDSPPPPASGKLFQLGGRFEGGLRRTPAGWRISRLSLKVSWTTGIGVPAIAATMTAANAGAATNAGAAAKVS
jgi:ketosteroid isomerase-like protein